MRASLARGASMTTTTTWIGLAAILLATLASSEHDDSEDKLEKVSINLLMNDKLLFLECRASSECKQTARKIDFDDVRDFAIDDALSRIYWVTKNGVNYVYDSANDSSISLLPTSEKSLMIYDLWTYNLHVVWSDDIAMKPICISDFYPRIIDAWIDPFATNYVAYGEGRFQLSPEEKFVKIVRDYVTGLFFVLAKNKTEEKSNHNIYGFSKHSRRLLVKNAPSEEFDCNNGMQRLFWVEGTAIVSVDYSGNNRMSFNTGYDLMQHISIDDHHRMWLIFKNGSSEGPTIGWCKPDGTCRPLIIRDGQKLKDQRLQRLLVRRDSIDIPEKSSKCQMREDCTSNYCLLDPCWPYRCDDCEKRQEQSPGFSCGPIHAKRKGNAHKHKRQIPFDMYSQQPTLRPEPLPTQPDVAYLPFYLYPGK